MQKVDLCGNIMKHMDITWKFPQFTLLEIVDKLKEIERRNNFAKSKEGSTSETFHLTKDTEIDLVQEITAMID